MYCLFYVNFLFHNNIVLLIRTKIKTKIFIDNIFCIKFLFDNNLVIKNVLVKSIINGTYNNKLNLLRIVIKYGFINKMKIK